MEKGYVIIWADGVVIWCVCSHLIGTPLFNRDFLRAAGECPRLLGEDATLWERWIYNFASRRQLAVLTPLIPLKSPRLSQTTYEMVLYHFLDNDHQAFLDTIQRWGKPFTAGKQY